MKTTIGVKLPSSRSILFLGVSYGIKKGKTKLTR